MKILVINSGSSSQKLSLYDLDEIVPPDPPATLWEGRIEWDGEQAAILTKRSGSPAQRDRVRVPSRPKAVEHLLGCIWSGPAGVLSSPSEINVVGHRVVHGGAEYQQPVLITETVKSGIARVSSFAPLHNRAELEGVDAIERLIGPVAQVAVFDTGFHRDMPLSAVVYPLPYEWFAKGLRRYGFHGINHQYCAGRAAELLGRELESLKLVTCHLGNGCSLAAIQARRSIDTTMGFTPLEGLMMGSRSGSIDPGILTYLIRQKQINPDHIDEVLNERSGLLGVSGISADMRHILAAMKEGNTRAKLAFDIYVHRLQAGIGAMVAILGGINALVFTAGVGENSPEVREAACNALKFAGLQLDLGLNARPALDLDIATPDSSVRILVIRAQEDWAIARECWKLMRAKALRDGTNKLRA